MTGSYVFPKNAVFLVELSLLLGGNVGGLIPVGGKVFSFCHNPPRPTLGPIQSRPVGAVTLPVVERPEPCFDHWLLSSVAYRYELQPHPPLFLHSTFKGELYLY